MINFTPIEYFSLGFIIISTHGLMIAIGVLIAYLFLRKEAKEQGTKIKTIDDLMTWAIIGGIVGARIFYVALNPQYYQNIIDAFKVWEGGLVSFGGIIGGVLAMYVYTRIKRLNFLDIADLVIPYGLLGWGIGRIGDFLSWGEFGTVTSMPWGINVGEGVGRHPTQLYTLFILLAGFFIIQKLKKSKQKKFAGYYFLLSVGFYFTHRFLLEFIRDYPGDSSIISYNLFAQAVSFLLIILSLYFFIVFRKRAQGITT